MRRLHLSSIVVAAAVAAGCAEQAGSSEAEGHVEQAASSSTITRGKQFFFNEFPGVQGNGRACETCHVANDAFGLTPAHVQERWAALQAARQTNPNADDPLFRSIDADDHASDFTTLRNFALVRVVIKLPTDAQGNKLVWPVDDPDATEVELFRSVPTIFNVAMTAPYQLDGREPTLQAQALGALRGHAQIQHDPLPMFLDDVANYQKDQFSSPGVRSVAEALAAGQTPPDPDPPLNDFEAVGKQIFNGACALCHGGPTGTQPLPLIGDAAGNIFVSRPLPPFAGGLPFANAPPLAVRLWAMRVPGSDEPVVQPSTDPGKALITGRASDFNSFEVPMLFGVSKTAPYFHDNSAKDLTEVLFHYQALFEALQRIFPEGDPRRPPPFPTEAFPPLLAYLAKL